MVIYGRPLALLVVQFVNESRFANRGFANLFFDFDESQFSKFQIFSSFVQFINKTSMKTGNKALKCILNNIRHLNSSPPTYFNS